MNFYYANGELKQTIEYDKNNIVSINKIYSKYGRKSFNLYNSYYFESKYRTKKSSLHYSPIECSSFNWITFKSIRESHMLNLLAYDIEYLFEMKNWKPSNKKLSELELGFRPKENRKIKIID